jgi:hypothetical protein
MFLAGLKFALGFVVGLTLFLSVAILALIGAARFDLWRERRRQLYAPKAHTLQTCHADQGVHRILLSLSYKRLDIDAQ